MELLRSRKSVAGGYSVIYFGKQDFFTRFDAQICSDFLGDSDLAFLSQSITWKADNLRNYRQSDGNAASFVLNLN